MTTDERLELQMEAAGYDLQDDADAREFQERLDVILDRQRETARQMPPRKVEKLRGIML